MSNFSDDSCTEHLEDNSSVDSNSATDEGEVVSGLVRPYAHEPLASCSDSEDSDSDNEDEDGISPAILEARFEEEVELNDWCECGKCITEHLSGAREFRCCKEVKPVVGKLVFDGSIERVQCITQHEDYSYLVYKEVLLMVGPLLKDKNGKAYRRPQPGQIDREFCRAVAYRWIIKWICGYMGWENRRPLPACVYNDIRTKYPAHHAVGYSQGN